MFCWLHGSPFGWPVLFINTCKDYPHEVVSKGFLLLLLLSINVFQKSVLFSGRLRMRPTGRTCPTADVISVVYTNRNLHHSKRWLFYSGDNVLFCAIKVHTFFFFFWPGHKLLLAVLITALASNIHAVSGKGHPQSCRSVNYPDC